MKFKMGLIFIMFIVSSLFYSSTITSNLHADSIDLTPNAISLIEVWNYTAGDAIYTSPAFIDQNGDLELEIVFGSDDGYVYCVDNTGELVWKYQTGAYVRSSPAVADINNDNSMDIVVASDDDNIYCLDINGALIWKAYMHDPIANLLVVDLDLDGYYEILANDNDDDFYVLDHQGMSLWNYSDLDYYYGGDATVCDYTGTAELEIILNGALGLLYLSHTGTVLDYVTPSDYTQRTVVVADLNRSGINQLLYYESGDTLVCVNVSNPTEEYWRITDLSDESTISTPVVADIDSDGALEILILATKPGFHGFAGQGILYCIESNGSIVWSDASLFFGDSQPLVSDIDNDGDLEIITVDSYVDQNRIYCYSHLGDQIFGFTNTGAITNSPLVIDIDNDNIVELLCPRLDGNLTLVELTGVTASGRTVWSREKCSTFNVGQADFDGDHIDDLSEEFYGIDPELIDSDADGLIDWQEIYSFSTDPANADTDGDGYDDSDEIAEGTDPTDPNDHPIEETPTPTPTNTTTTSEGSLIGGMVGLLAVGSTALFILVATEKRRKYIK